MFQYYNSSVLILLGFDMLSLTFLRCFDRTETSWEISDLSTIRLLLWSKGLGGYEIRKIFDVHQSFGEKMKMF